MDDRREVLLCWIKDQPLDLSRAADLVAYLTDEPWEVLTMVSKRTWMMMMRDSSGMGLQIYEKIKEINGLEESIIGPVVYLYPIPKFCKLQKVTRLQYYEKDSADGTPKENTPYKPTSIKKRYQFIEPNLIYERDELRNETRAMVENGDYSQEKLSILDVEVEDFYHSEAQLGRILSNGICRIVEHLFQERKLKFRREHFQQLYFESNPDGKENKTPVVVSHLKVSDEIGVLMDSSKRSVCLIELKIPKCFTDGNIESWRKETIRNANDSHACYQTYNDMCLSNLGFAVLGDGEKFTFLERKLGPSGQIEENLHYTPYVTINDPDFLLIWYRFIQKALSQSHVTWKQPPKKYSLDQIDDEDYAPETDSEMEGFIVTPRKRFFRMAKSSVSNYKEDSSPEKKTRRAVLRKVFSELRAERKKMQRQFQRNKLVFDRHVFSCRNEIFLGSYGTVDDVIIKFCYFDTEPEKLVEFKNEVQTYLELKDAQGEWIPELLFCGFYSSESYCIGLSKVGQSLNEDLLIRHLVQVETVIRKFQARHFLHRDLKADNILVNSEGKVFLIDFGFSVKCYDAQKRTKELEDFLRKVLSLPQERALR